MEKIIICGWYAKSSFNMSLDVIKILSEKFIIHYWGSSEFKKYLNEDIIFHEIKERKDIFISSEINGFEIRSFESCKNKEEYEECMVHQNKRLLEYYKDILDESYEELKSIGAKFIIRDFSAINGYFLAKKLNIQSMAFNTMMTISEEKFINNPKKYLPFYNRVNKNIIEKFDEKIYLRIKSKCKENSMKYGVPYISPTYVVNCEDKYSFGFFGKPFQYEDKSRNYRLFNINNKIKFDEKFDDEINRVLESELDLIYISSGSFLVQDIEYYKKIIKIFAGQKINVIISIPCKFKYSSNENNIIIRKFVNQEKILKKAKLIFSSGGYNTVMESIKYEVPMIITPIDFDQYYNGYNIKKYRIGEVVRTEELNGECIEKILKDIEEYKRRMREIKKEFFDNRSIEEILGFIEEMKNEKV
ncbi:MAG: glycosyltransferase [Clostridium sp.]|uniref:glycosyltransferase n=1 Tax=Clostridium sp. TaxID=1506 RepID=UPI003EE60244